MSNCHLIIPDAHAHPDHNNDRALWLGELINDVRPSVIINLGDSADMPSLASYEKGKRSFHGNSYSKDIGAHLDFQDKLWSTVRKAKRKMPRRIVLIGNHEQRIDRALDMSPELEGTLSYADLELDRWYDEVVPYVGNTPGTICVDGITYAHYFVSGVMGRPIGGEHPAHALLSKKYASCTQGHSHVYDHCFRTREDGRRMYGLVAGVFQDYDSEWAGTVNRLWFRGCFIKRNVEGGSYNLQAIDMDALKSEYKK